MRITVTRVPRSQTFRQKTLRSYKSSLRRRFAAGPSVSCEGSGPSKLATCAAYSSCRFRICCTEQQHQLVHILIVSSTSREDTFDM